MPLRDRIIAEIQSAGAISVARYMELNNQHYYATRDPFGAAGDFTTAPEISQLFGEMIGAWLIDAWHRLGKPDPCLLVEAGPGRGTLMADILRIAKLDAAFLNAISVHLIETSPVLRERQKEILQEHKITWHDGFETLPDLPCFLIANEFFDALPVEQWIKKETGWHQRTIQYKKDHLVFSHNHQTTEFNFDAPLNAIHETQDISNDLLHVLLQKLQKNTGAALIIDYDSTQIPPRDTLQAVKNHRAISLLDDPGNADMTAHVDFAQFQKITDDLKCPAQGPTGQGTFLKNLGIEQRADILCRNANEAQEKQIITGLHRLTATDQMGELFKVMCFSSPDSQTAGF